MPHNQTVTPIHLQKITYTSVSFFKHSLYSCFPVNVTLKALSRELGGYLIHFSFFPSPQNCNEKGSRERETTLLLKIFGPNNFCRWGYPVQDVASLLFCSLKSYSWTCPSDLKMSDVSYEVKGWLEGITEWSDSYKDCTDSMCKSIVVCVSTR